MELKMTYEQLEEHEEKISIIENAILKIENIMVEVDGIISGTSQQAHYEAYGKYGFNQLLGNGNPYDSSLKSLIEELHEEFDCSSEVNNGI